MENFLYYINNIYHFVFKQFRMIYWTDIVDILILSLFLYGIFRFARDRRAGRLVVGIIAIFVVYAVSELFNFNSVAYILRYLVVEAGILVFVILFQSEIRALLEKLGEEPFRGIKNIGESKQLAQINSAVDAICGAVSDMSREKTGALIVFERTTKLGDIIRSGVEIDSKVSSYMLKNIFFTNAPLHDGAVIIRNMRICAAGCFLPLSTQAGVDQNLGTRHRAALGMSESSDAVVVVVSEESGNISLAIGGNITREYNYHTLKQALVRMFTNGSISDSED